MAYPLIDLVFAPAKGDEHGEPSRARGGRQGRSAREVSSIRGGALHDRDAETLRAIRTGDETAFTALVHDLALVLQTYAYQYVGSADVARDVVQDVFVHVWERRETLIVAGTLRQYLFVATRLRSLEALRRHRMEGRHAGRVAEEGMASEAPHIEEELDRVDRFIAVTRAVHELPPRQREIVRLRWVEGYTNARVAEVLGISVKGVEIQLTRALQTLRARLRE